MIRFVSSVSRLRVGALAGFRDGRVASHRLGFGFGFGFGLGLALYRTQPRLSGPSHHSLPITHSLPMTLPLFLFVPRPLVYVYTCVSLPGSDSGSGRVW